MTKLAELLETRWRAEIAEWRTKLDPDAPVVQASAPNIPAIFRGPKDEWTWVGILDPKRPRVRVATYGETLDMLEQHAKQYAEIETATIEKCVRTLVPGDEAAQNTVFAKLAEHWPWTRIGGSEAEIFDIPALRARAEIATRIEREASPPVGRPRGSQTLPWPDGVERTEVVEWVAEGLEQHETGRGSHYRDWCTGVAPIRVFQGVEPDAPFTHEFSKDFLREDTGWPDSVDFNVVTPYGTILRRVVGHQLAWLYWASPTSRAVRSYLTRIASGDAQKRLITLIAPRAIKEEKGEASEAAVGKLAEQVRQGVKALNDALPVSIASEPQQARAMDSALVSHLESIGTRGKAIADGIRPKLDARSPGEHWRLWQHEAEGERFLVFLARALWKDRVLPELQKKAQRENEPARISMPLASTAGLGRLHGGVPSGSSILVEPPRGIALLLDFDGIQINPPKETKRSNGLVNLRTILDGAALRDYLAYSIQWFDAGAPPDGMFSVEDEQILEMTGATKHVEKKNGRHYERFATKSRQSLQRHRIIYQAIRVRQVGNIEAAIGDVLLDEIRERLEGKRRWFAHSRLMTHHMLNDYARIPRAVCRLRADDVPMAIAMGMLVRERVVNYVAGHAAIEAPLLLLAEKAGVDLRAGVRKDGPKYIEAFAANAVRVANEGQIGAVRINGRGRDATITIDLSDPLKGSYAPLIAHPLMGSYAPLIEAAAKRRRAKKAAMVRDAMRKD
jgi:hypothetical protein